MSELCVCCLGLVCMPMCILVCGCGDAGKYVPEDTIVCCFSITMLAIFCVYLTLARPIREEVTSMEKMSP